MIGPSPESTPAILTPVELFAKWALLPAHTQGLVIAHLLEAAGRYEAYAEGMEAHGSASATLAASAKRQREAMGAFCLAASLLDAATVMRVEKAGEQ